MSFFKKLVGGVNKAVGSLAGIGAKILPAPLGTAAKAVQGISSFGDKLLSGSSSNKTASAKASVGKAAAAASAVSVGGGVTVDAGTKKKNWFQENMAWVIPAGLAFLGFLGWLIFGRKK